jgi:ABC-type Fe3+/spermidine/putrescine transport system ATPase subunit
VQTGPPSKLYRRPANRFVADFLGETNFIPGEVAGTEGEYIMLNTPFGKLACSVFPDDLPQGGAVTCSIRPEAIQLVTAAQANGKPNTFAAEQTRLIYLGSLAQHRLSVGDHELKAFELNPQPANTGESLTCHVDPADVVILRD